jgi:hypothetical protein
LPRFKNPTRINLSYLQTILFKLPETHNLCSPSLGAAESERILAEEGCAMFERSEFAPAAKIRVDEGSLAQPNLQPGSPFFAYFIWRSKESKWPRGHEAQSKTIRKRIQNTVYGFLK